MKYQTQTIEEVNSLIEKRNSVLPLKVEDERRLQKKYRLEFNYNSNHLEGNTLTYGQTELLLLFDKSTGDVKLSDLEEMKAHDVALTMIKDMAKEKERPLTEQFIKELNKIILVRPFWKEAITADGIETRKKIEIGSYKNTPNSVKLRNGDMHYYASPEETPAKMDDLMTWYLGNIDTVHPIQLAAEFHYRFVFIHPFDDGNGRVARLIMNYILLRFDYPLVIIKSKDKEAYLTALQKADVGDISAIIEYIEKQMLWSLGLEIKAANGEDLEEDDDIDKEIALLKREKLNKPILYKTPKVAFETVDYFNDKLWPNFIKVLGRFEDFFTEFESVIIVSGNLLSSFVVENYQIPVEQTRNYKVNELSQVIKSKAKEISVIREVQWNMNMIALKSASIRVDYKISSKVILNDTSFEIVCEEDSYFRTNEIFIVSQNYGDVLSSNKIKEIEKKLSKFMLDSIRDQK